MLYKQFVPITEILNKEIVEKFDFWLATLPSGNTKNITATAVSARLSTSYAEAKTLLGYAEKWGILEKYFIVKCPECGSLIDTIAEDQIAEVLMNSQYCYNCEVDKDISANDIYIAYKVIKRPDVTEAEIERAIENRIKMSNIEPLNFPQADSLNNEKVTLFNAFYNPNESAYKKFSELREQLDLDYGKDTTAKGNALENLVLEIFNSIKMVSCSREVRTPTNQFDCTVMCHYNIQDLSVSNYLSPYFIVECKNEKTKPGNTYINKLLSIMDTNEAKVGILFSRKEAKETCVRIAREHYLQHSNATKQQIVVLFSDKDLEYLIDKKVNLLKYMEFKIFQVTANSPNSKFEMFNEE